VQGTDCPPHRSHGVPDASRNGGPRVRPPSRPFRAGCPPQPGAHAPAAIGRPPATASEPSGPSSARGTEGSKCPAGSRCMRASPKPSTPAETPCSARSTPFDINTSFQPPHQPPTSCPACPGCALGLGAFACPGPSTTPVSNPRAGMRLKPPAVPKRSGLRFIPLPCGQILLFLFCCPDAQTAITPCGNPIPAPPA